MPHAWRLLSRPNISHAYPHLGTQVTAYLNTTVRSLQWTFAGAYCLGPLKPRALNIHTRCWGTNGPCASFNGEHIGKCTHWLLKHYSPPRPLCCGFSASQNLAWYQICQILDPITVSGLNYFPLIVALRCFDCIPLLHKTIKHWKFASSVDTFFYPLRDILLQWHDSILLVGC